MPKTLSAIKRARQNLVRTARLKPYKTAMKTLIRKVSDAAQAGDVQQVTSLLPQAYKVIDTAAKKGLIHRKNADRKKSMLARMAAPKT